MNQHLEEISAKSHQGLTPFSSATAPDGISGARSCMVPDNITLLSLPPYSPELNPMENVWAYLRQNKLCALVWQTYEDILDACQSAWRFLIHDPDRIRSIGTRDWACVNL